MNWIEKTVFYHIYPLGLCGCPQTNDYAKLPTECLDKLYPWLDHIEAMGFNGLYIGPLFESKSHGYDSTDYFKVDRRLGDNQSLSRFVSKAHGLGIKVVFDAVFNHVGRDFWAFQDVLQRQQKSNYCDWFAGLNFEHDNHFHDGFIYEGWAGHDNLVKLNLTNANVRGHLFEVVHQWINDYQVDGLRLDAADVMDKDFLSEIARKANELRPGFWLMGEVVHGDYNQWAGRERLDSVTNYEAFKGLYSSFNDHNFFEIAWTLNRQFGKEGIYKDLLLYSFADNHDVSRVATLLRNPAHLVPLYTLMFSMPGVPSVYYGSEFGVTGDRKHGDQVLRPALDLSTVSNIEGSLNLLEPLKKLIQVRKGSQALQMGGYQQLFLTNDQFAFSRETDDQLAITAINAADQPFLLEFQMPGAVSGQLTDVLQPEFSVKVDDQHQLKLELPPNSSRLLFSG